ncbi:hypothetical protein LZ30DRAFT_31636 [Colletotrichum cereale]|nr:hypothetical protein LZ30DRAFT_31636 [Colletotrichum cereale]
MGGWRLTHQTFRVLRRRLRQLPHSNHLRSIYTVPFIEIRPSDWLLTPCSAAKSMCAAYYLPCRVLERLLAGYTFRQHIAEREREGRWFA